ncbi:MAG: glycosyltransferase family 39 protein [Candidatus Omnitrophota bacterium]
MNRKVLLILAAIILAAMVARLWGLSGRGLFSPDETRYYRDAVMAKASIDGYCSSPVVKNFKGFMASLLPLTEAFAGKPGHTFLGLLALYLFGAHQYSVLLMNALLATATVPVVFLIGRKLHNEKTGLIAAALLAVCSAHVYFSRSFLAHTDQAFFLMLGTYLYLDQKRAFAALCLGYAFLVHPTGIIYFLPFAGYEFFLLITRKRRFGQITGFTACFFLPFLALESVSLFGRSDFGSLIVALKQSYLGQMLYNSGEALALGAHNNRSLGPFHYGIMSLLSNGVLATSVYAAGLAGGIVFFIKQRNAGAFITCAVPAALFIYWQYVTGHERLFREIIFLFPFFCIMSAVLMVRLNRKLAAALLIVLIGEGAWYSAKAIMITSEYPRIERFLIDQRVDKVMTPSEYISTTTDVLMPGLKDVKIYRVAGSEEAREVRAREGVSFMIATPGEHETGRMVSRRASPVISIREPNRAYLPSFYEDMRIRGELGAGACAQNADLTTVAVYDIRKEKRS